MASRGSTDHGSLYGRLSPENKPLFILNILLLKVKVIMWLYSVSEDRTCANFRLLHVTLPQLLRLASTPGLCSPPPSKTSRASGSSNRRSSCSSSSSSESMHWSSDYRGEKGLVVVLASWLPEDRLYSASNSWNHFYKHLPTRPAFLWLFWKYFLLCRLILDCCLSKQPL